MFPSMLPLNLKVAIITSSFKSIPIKGPSSYLVVMNFMLPQGNVWPTRHGCTTIPISPRADRSCSSATPGEPKVPHPRVNSYVHKGNNNYFNNPAMPQSKID